jgi:hypothetical protein
MRIIRAYGRCIRRTSGKRTGISPYVFIGYAAVPVKSKLPGKTIKLIVSVQ